jgi:hypothetical protein
VPLEPEPDPEVPVPELPEPELPVPLEPEPDPEVPVPELPLPELPLDPDPELPEPLLPVPGSLVPLPLEVPLLAWLVVEDAVWLMEPQPCARKMATDREREATNKREVFTAPPEQWNRARRFGLAAGKRVGQTRRRRRHGCTIPLTDLHDSQ